MKRCSARPYEGHEDYIFVSYCHKDKAHVFPIIEQLARDGHRIWYDEGIDPGSEWPEIIARHLSGCSVCLAFISQNSLNSHNCRREINFALLKKKTFISTVVEPVQMSVGMEMQLSSSQSIFKYKLATQSEFFDKLYSAKELNACRGSRDDSIPVSRYEDYVTNNTDSDKVRDPFSDKWFTVGASDDSQKKAEQERLDKEAEERRIAEERQRAEEAEARRIAEEERKRAEEAEARRKAEEERKRAEEAEARRIAEEERKRAEEAEARRIAEEERKRAEEAEARRIAEEERKRAEEAEARRKAEEERKKAEEANKKLSHILKREKTNETITISKNEFVIGRSETRADYVIIDNRAISRVHSTFYIDGAHCYVSDNNSVNKTFVNGCVLNENDRIELKDGDVIKVYNEKFVYYLSENV